MHSELILNDDGSIYHLNLLPGDVARTILLVGDPGRVSMVSKYFDEITVEKAKREFITHTGRIGHTELTVISTGIGTDNIDIVLNEIDALFNVDLETREPKQDLTQLAFIRIGTSGALQESIPVDSLVLSRYGLGLDAFARYGKSFTDENSAAWYNAMIAETIRRGIQVTPAYMSMASSDLVERFSGFTSSWITITCAGFYSLQGRSIRIESEMTPLFEALKAFEHNGLRAGNLEMETAGLYLLAELLGHKAVSLNAIIANRSTREYSRDAYATVDKMIRHTLKSLAST